MPNSLPSKPWVLSIHGSDLLYGCEAYRLWIPMCELQRRGKIADYVRSDTINEYAQKAAARGGAGPWDYDIYVMQRHTIAAPNVIRDLQKSGKHTVFEVDDDFTNRHRHVIDDGVYDSIWDCARACDATTVSTSYLADLMRCETGKPSYVLPNSLDWSMWRDVRQIHARLTIGLTGSITHEADWAVLADVMPQVLEQHPDVDLYVGGYVPDWVEELVENYGERVRTEPFFRDYRDYPSTIGQIDIGLCPVDPTDLFNWSKSGIKAIELLAAGAAVVASGLNIYRPILGCNSNRGLLVKHTPEAWLDAINVLITNQGLRHELAERGRRYVRQHYCIDQTWHLWWRAYRDIAKE